MRYHNLKFEQIYLKCLICNDIKKLEEFDVSERHYDYYRYYKICKTCRNKKITRTRIDWKAKFNRCVTEMNKLYKKKNKNEKIKI